MFLKQYYLSCLAHASYLIGDAASGTAVVVDPQRDIERYVDDAERERLQIRHVFLTHFHADFVAGHLELRDRTGASIHLGARAQADYPFVPMADGASLDFGRTRLTVLETPGHTVESISVLVFDQERDSRNPQAILTGDTLFIGDVGRPDLRASLGWSAAELGSLLYRSLHAKILPLPDETLVYPAHGAGSLCGKSLSTETVSTLGDQRRLNYALQPMSEMEFVALVTADQPDAPPYFTYDAVLNTKERPTLPQVLERELHPLSLDELLALRDTGVQVLDVRDPAEYARAHLVGSLNIGLGGAYATWAGTILEQDKPIAIVAEPERHQQAAMRLGRIGFDTVVGYLRDGISGLEGRPDLLEGTERVTPAEAAAEMASAPPVVLDVRSPKEWAQSRIDGSLNIPLNHLVERLQELPRDRRVLVHCAGGYRSSIAAGLLLRHGIKAIELAGGIAAWERADLPLRLQNGRIAELQEGREQE